MKRSYLSGITPHFGFGKNPEKKILGWICWYRVGGKIRGDLRFEVFDTEAEAKSFAATLKK
jgi:hypothetical protein